MMYVWHTYRLEPVYYMDYPDRCFSFFNRSTFAPGAQDSALHEVVALLQVPRRCDPRDAAQALLQEAHTDGACGAGEVKRLLPRRDANRCQANRCLSKAAVLFFLIIVIGTNYKTIYRTIYSTIYIKLYNHCFG